MKAYEGFEAKKSVSATEALPAGGYVAKILKAEVAEYSWGDVLIISFDIAEGDYKGHFRKRWDADASSDYGQKWKGNFRLNIPSDKSRYPDYDKRAFNNAIWAIQASNPKYKWNWQEETLKGKMIGVRKSWLKVQHSENEDYGIWSHHFMENRWGNSVRLYFFGLQNHCRW